MDDDDTQDPRGGARPPDRVRWWRFGLADWVTVARRTVHQIRLDNVPIVSAGVAFYAVLAIIPLVIMAVTIYGLVTDPAEAEEQIASLLDVMPSDAASLVGGQMRPIASSASGALSIGFVVSAVALMWTASNATRATVRAIVIAYDEEAERSRFETRLASIGLTAAVLVAFAVIIGVVAVVPAWLSITSTPVPAAGLRWMALFAIVSGGSLMLYRYVPTREAPGWGSLIPGAALAAASWAAVSIGFSIYVENFGSYNETYGILGGAVVLLMWFFLSALTVLVGAELSAELERHAVEGE